MSHYGKNRVNKGLYGKSKRNRPYSNANMTAPKEFIMPMIDFDEIRRRIELILHIPDLYQRLEGTSHPERGVIIFSPVIDITQPLPEIDHEPILVVGAGYQHSKIVDDIIVQDLKMLLATLNHNMRKRALEVLNDEK